MDLEKDLNDPQREAVQTIDGPLLILAGAGSGKTRAITYRITHLIRDCGVRPANVLAVTFTNKAAGEMKHRVEELLGGRFDDLTVSTFHSLCARVLRRHADRLGYPRDFSIYDQQDSHQVIKKVVAHLGLPAKQFTPGAVAGKISSAKDRLLDPADYAKTCFDYFSRETARIYEEYQKTLREVGALDFDDLILQTVRLLETVADVREYYQQRFVYVMVDEYQDTNFAQYRLVKELSDPQGNLCVVGDDDQSIYTWRGADIRNILEFETDYPNARVVVLEQNYRSTPNILDAAYAVVCGNYRRKDKKLWTNRPAGETINVILAESDTAEADLITGRIKSLREAGQYNLSDCAILYRTNAQSRSFEEAMRRFSLPYVLVGGVKFFQRKEVKDVLAYAILVLNPRDIVAVRRVINYPKRGLGSTTQTKLEQAAAAAGRPALEFLADIAAVENIVGPRVAAKVAKFAALIDELREAKAQKNLGDWMRLLVERIGIKEELSAEDPAQAQTRIENVDELVAGAAEYAMIHPEAGLEEFLAEVALITDIDRWDPDTDAVTLMTLHSAKGLEFPVVFIAGLEEGLFPLSQAMDDPEKLAEERRLFYVGATRAKERLSLTYARTRRRFGESVNMKSRFLEELPEDSYAVENHIGYDRLGPGGLSYERKRIVRRTTQRAADSWEADLRPTPVPGGMNDVTSILQAGMRVLHPKFGEGLIESIAGYGESLRCEVAFKSGAVKTIIARYANFEILGV